MSRDDITILLEELYSNDKYLELFFVQSAYIEALVRYFHYMHFMLEISLPLKTPNLYTEMVEKEFTSSRKRISELAKLTLERMMKSFKQVYVNI